MRVALLLLISLPLQSFAQEKFHGFYANIKGGIGNFSNDLNTAFSGEGGLIRNKNIFSVAYLRAEEVDDREVINTIEFTYGRFIQNKNFVFHYQLGLGPVWNGKETDSDKKVISAGLPVKTGVKFVPPDFFSIGLDLQANINSEKSLYLVMLTFGVWPRRTL